MKKTELPSLIGCGFFYGCTLHIIAQILITAKGQIWFKSEAGKYHNSNDVDLVALTIE